MGRALEFAKCTYLNLPVTLTETTCKKLSLTKADINVQVNSYKNGNYLTKTGPELTAKDKLLSAYSLDSSPDKPEPPAAFKSPESFMIVFSGLGSPDHISFVLTLAAHYAALGKLAVSLKPDVSTQLQKYCTANIGLCCLGWASNYALGKIGSTKYRDKSGNTSYEKFVSSKFKMPWLWKLSQIDFLYKHDGVVLVYYVEVKDETGKVRSAGPGKHAVVIDEVSRIDDSTRQVTVMESLGEGSKTGLQQNTFVLHGDAKDYLFDAERITPQVTTMRTLVYAVQLLR